VAGCNRLLGHREQLQQAQVIIVVAEWRAHWQASSAAVSAPVVAVPTSVGYGASFHGLAALLAMLNSCASGVTVVNIDNGFGAGYFAALAKGRRGNVPSWSSHCRFSILDSPVQVSGPCSS
jgi:NCAIR mutase (PurE)-related protein